jgi:NADH:ubiquinone oxidoreductase subunit E
VLEEVYQLRIQEFLNLSERKRMAFEKIDLILEKYRYKHEEIIGIMQDAQVVENYLPETTLRHISKKMEIPLTRLFDIATFYKSFSLQPRGRHIIKVCLGTACHLNGAVQNPEQIERTLHIRKGETTGDMMFSLETVNCLGACALAPVAVVDDVYHDAVTPGKVEKVLSRYAKEPEDAQSEAD